MSSNISLAEWGNVTQSTERSNGAPRFISVSSLIVKSDHLASGVCECEEGHATRGFGVDELMD